MAGVGPAPAENRRRRNEPTRGDWIDLEPITNPVLPELPDRSEGEDPWTDRTREAWEMWRMDPATSRYTSADISFALDTIAIYNAGMNATAAKEVRMRMTDLGLSPEGKKKLRYRVPEPDAVTSGAPAARRKRASGRRDRLSVVK